MEKEIMQYVTWQWVLVVLAIPIIYSLIKITIYLFMQLRSKEENAVQIEIKSLKEIVEKLSDKIDKLASKEYVDNKINERTTKILHEIDKEKAVRLERMRLEYEVLSTAISEHRSAKTYIRGINDRIMMLFSKLALTKAEEKTIKDFFKDIKKWTLENAITVEPNDIAERIRKQIEEDE